MSSSLDCRSCMSHLIFIQRKITKINFRNNPRVSFNNAIKFYINIQSAKTRPGADCGSDHELLIAKFRLKLKKVGKSTRPFMYDLNQIHYNYTVEVRNRFKGLDLIDRVPDELWTEVCDIVQETGIKTIPIEKKCKKAKWLSEEALQIAVKRREAKAKEKRKDISI